MKCFCYITLIPCHDLIISDGTVKSIQLEAEWSLSTGQSAVMCECVSVRLDHWLQLQQQQFVSEQHSWHKSAFHPEMFLVRESTKDLSRSWLIWIANGVPVRISNNNLRFE